LKNVNNSKLRIIPLGGLEQIGMNITAFEFEDSIVVVDCGLAFPEDDMLGIDLVIPENEWGQKAKDIQEYHADVFVMGDDWEGKFDELKAYFERWQEEGVAVDGVVFDVRNNTGGNLTNAMHVIDYLCPVGPIASQQNKDGTVTTLETSDASEVELPMVVLVNGNTSYAAELFATSIREFEKGRVVGTRTACKGTIQCRPVALSDGSAFSYTVGLLLSKNGATFNGTGISPDVEASLSAEEEANFYNFTVDTDPQASLTIVLGHPRPDDLPVTLTDLMTNVMQERPVNPEETILSHTEGVDLIPASIMLAGLEVSLVNAMSRETVLKQVLESVKSQYDYILLDYMPSIGMLTINALAAADQVLIPVQANYLSAKGLEQLLQKSLITLPSKKAPVIQCSLFIC